jgi:DNA polymerase
MTDRYSTPRLSTDDRISGLAVIRQEVSRCQLCPDLCSTRKNTVFGDGPPQVRLCFVGEGPGADEDREGIPFVGRAGQLLNKIIEACRMKRSEVYILNTVKCRPPGNRNPHDSELENCWPFAERQLEILQPEFICCLGSVAARTMLKTNESIGRLRGRFFGYRGSQVMVTYHPAYLLRNPPAKVQVWDDMQLLMKAMGQPV